MSQPPEPIDWSELLPGKRFGFVLRLERGDPARFFGSADPGGTLLAERARWIDASPRHHLAAGDGVEPLVREMDRLASGWGSRLKGAPVPGESPARAMERLGRSLEPDFVLLRRTDDGFRLAGGCVCFPSSWSLPEKAGRSVAEIHGIVPGLNEALGRAIDVFLSRMAPGIAWLRSNWGLSRTAERNQDPWRGLPRLAPGIDPAAIFFRLERQALVRLPESDGVLFGIRVESIGLGSIIRLPAARDGLLAALDTMPDAVAEYKGIQPVRRELVAWIRSRAS